MDIPENSIRKILENSPSQGTLCELLTIMKDNGSLNLVIKECLKALIRFPGDLKLRKILAEAYLADGRLLEAEAEFEKVISGIKILAGAFKTQAEIYVREKREDAAMISLKQYLSLFPEDQEAISLLNILAAAVELPPAEIMKGKDDFDITDDQEQTEFPEIITASLAETYFKQGRLNQAREIYEKLTGKNPEDTASRLRLDKISALMDHKETPEALTKENILRNRKERMISILDSWRSNVSALAHKEDLTTR